MRQLFPLAWYGKARWVRWLRPFSAVYGLVSRRRRQAWRSGRRQVWRAEVPVIVIGNLCAGGTGKTPLTLALCRHLQQAGYRPAIVSRGYGGKSPAYPLRVTAETPPRECGDEALLLALNTEAPVVVDPDRVRAVRQLEEEAVLDLILCDDGLQHYALARDIEIAVLDGSRGFGNGLLLPAGPLRETPQRLREVDYVVVNGEGAVELPAGAPAAVRMHLVAGELVNIVSGESLSCADWLALHGARHDRVHAIAGIGNPERFFTTLCAEGFAIIAHPFPDHHRFRAGDITFADERPVLMTEKDAVKCLPIATERHWCLKVRAEVPAAFLQSLTARLDMLTGRVARQGAPEQEPAQSEFP